MRQINFRAMGCEMSAFIDSDRLDSATILDQVPLWFETWEQSLSRFRPTSELCQLNSTHGSFRPVSNILWAVIQAALRAAQETDGMVSPTILKSLEQAGYDQSFEKIKDRNGKQASFTRLQSDLPQSTWKDIQLDPSTQSVLLPRDVTLDLGGIAKGWAAHQAMLRLQRFGPALMNAGGDIALSGPRENGDFWPIAVEDPHLAQENLGVLLLAFCGVATSGTDYRRWMINQKLNHHIIDSRTGEPARTDLMTVTVIAPDVLQAEAAAKTILILGSQSGLDWLECHTDFYGILALENGQIIYSNRLDYVWS